MHVRLHFKSCLLLAYVALGVQSLLYAQVPSWWAERGLTSDQPADDYAVINQGQLKHIVQRARLEITASLPGGMGEQETDLNEMMWGWDANEDMQLFVGLKGEYFSGITLSGTPVYAAYEQVDFNWDTNSPIAGVVAEDFSVRWTGAVVPDLDGNYIFETLSDDGVRLWVNNELIIDRWNLHSATIDRSRPMSLQAGKRYSIKLEYYEHTIHAVMKLRWVLPGQTISTIIPLSQLRPPGPLESDDYQAMNVGQLKHVAKPFYDRLAAVGYSGPPLVAGQLYPWGPSTDDYMVANIGQVKHIFSFDIRSFLFLKMDSDGDGLINSIELDLGTNPSNPDTDGDGIWDKVEISLGLNPLFADAEQAPSVIGGLRLHLGSGGVVADGSGFVSQWGDQSGVGNHAYQDINESKPRIVAGVMNGHSVIRFDGDDALSLPNLMEDTDKGEIFIVTRLSLSAAPHNVLAYFGSGYGTAYTDSGMFYNDFGNTDTNSYHGPGIAFYTQPHIFNSSVEAGGQQITRFDERTYLVGSASDSLFSSEPFLGADGMGGAYQGDIAEVIIYDHVLNADEREAIHSYLTKKYLSGTFIPSAPSLNAYAASSSEVDLSWGVATGAGQHITAILERRFGEGAFEVIATPEDTYTYTDRGLLPGVAYTYRVKIQSGEQVSGYSQVVVLTTPQTISSVPTSGLRLWLRSTAGVPAAGALAIWPDQSGMNNDAHQLDLTLQPQVVANAVNGRPSVRFSGAQVLNLPGILDGAVAGEIIALLRVGDKRPGQYADANNDIWNFGQPTGYYSDQVGSAEYFHYNSFGLDESQEFEGFPKALVSAYHIHNTVSDGVTWVERHNGEVYHSAVGGAVAFGAEPDLGSGFVGDFIEILVYDRVLGDVERNAIQSYLSNKYALASLDVMPPSSAVDLVASDIAVDSFTLSWPASTDNVGVTAYDIFCNDVHIGSVPTPGLSYVVTALAPATVYSVRVAVRDGAENTSILSAPLSVATLADTEAPSIPYGLVASDVLGDRFTLTWLASTDNVAVFEYDIYRNEMLVGSSSSPSFEVNDLASATGYDIRVSARDEAGNSSELSTPLTVTTNTALLGTLEGSDGVNLGSNLLSPGSPGGAIVDSQLGSVAEDYLMQELPLVALDSEMLNAVSTSALTTGPMLALGADFAIGMHSSGTALTWGSNSVGQLGVGSSAYTLIQPIPNPVRSSASATLTNIVSISAGNQHGLAITRAVPTTAIPNPPRVLRAWGRNESGQLGNNSTAVRNFAVAVIATPNTGLVNVLTADAGGAHSLAIKSDGTVWAWGANSSGQLGDNTLTLRKIPTRVITAPSVSFNAFVSGYDASLVAVAAGHDHSLVLRADGTVWAWGANTFGQLGTGDNVSRRMPVQVVGLPQGSSVLAIAAGKGFSAVLLSDGTVRTWGRDDCGQLGNDLSTSNSNVPVTPLGLDSSVLSIAVGETHMLARRSDGSVWGWGSNYAGELGGLLPAGRQSVPRMVLGLSNVAIVAAGSGRSAAMRNDGSVIIWGNPAGAASGTAGADLGPAGSALGGSEPGYRSTRVQLLDVKSAASIYAGGDQGAVIRANGRAYTFGHNASGQLGTGDRNPVVAPVRSSVPPTPDVYAFGARHALALADGIIYAAGNNEFGQLGDGTNTSRLTPVALVLTGPVTISPILDVAAGWNHSLLLRQDGTVWSWGNNASGQLGSSNQAHSNIPIQVKGPGNQGYLTGVIAIAAGETHSMALKADGTVWSWGGNAFGQLGTGTTVSSLVPIQVARLPIGNAGAPPIVAIAAGANHSLALTTTGTGLPSASRARVYAWGKGSFGQIGNGSTGAKVLKPYFITANNIIGIAAGANHSLARKADGSLLAWGRNHRGQLGNGYVAAMAADTKAFATKPIVINNTPVLKTAGGKVIAAGFNSSYAIAGDNSGTVYAWGEASHQQLGYDASRFVLMSFRLTPTASDKDSDGMPDQWEIDNKLTTAGKGETDADLDGLSNIQEYYFGTPPKLYDSDMDRLNDFADSQPGTIGNGDDYKLSIISGNNQEVFCGTVAPVPVVISIGERKLGVPIKVSSNSSTIILSDINSVGSYGQQTVTVITNSAGQASVYFKQADTAGSYEIRFNAGISDVATAIAHAVSPPSTLDDSAIGLPVRGNVKLWLTADAGVTADPNSGRVSQWSCNAGGGLVALQSTTSSQPVLNPAAHFGRPAVKFDGVDDTLQISGLTAVTSRFTLVWLIKPDSLATNQKIVSTSSGGFTFNTTPSGAAAVGTDTGTRIIEGANPGQIPSGTMAVNNWVLLSFVYNNGVGTFYKNGLPIATKSGMAAPADWGALHLGSTDTDTLHGDLAEVILYDRALPAQDILELRNYIFSKYDFYSDMDFDGRHDAEESAGGGVPSVIIISPGHNPSL
jgi:alpha-tubulin suppressor-like RCC1 family protein/chitodextrinase